MTENLKNNYMEISYSSERTIIIGDIHGCFDELMNLLDKINFNTNDLLLTVGDMIDRGPKTYDVVKFFMNTKNAVSCLGNHERRLLGTLKNEKIPAWTQKQTITRIPLDEINDWMRYLSELPAVIKANHVIITHARLDPDKELCEQDDYFTCAVGSYPNAIEIDIHGIPTWYNNLTNTNSVDKPICIGHRKYDSIELVKNKLYGLDTEVFKTGELTALVLPENKILKVNSGINYFHQSRKEWFEYILEEEPENVPITNITYLFNKENLNKNEKRLKIIVEDCINNSLIYEKIYSIRNDIFKIIGTLPEPIKREEYFKNIKSVFHDRLHKRIISFLMTNKFSETGYFFKMLPQNMKIEDINVMLIDMKNVIDNTWSKL